jgi:RNA polymerase sigma-70 factor (ECF subfamily)
VAATAEALNLMPAPGQTTDDEVLVSRAQAGDVPAFEALYRRYAGRVNALCLRMTGSRALAEDCVQEAFVQAWKNLDRFEGRSAFGTWLHRIAVNRVLTVQRAESRRPNWLQVADDDDPDPWGADPGETDPGKDIDLERAVATLPEGARNVFVLHAVHGYSHEETADFLGVAVGTCKAQLHRARRLLGERLER